MRREVGVAQLEPPRVGVEAPECREATKTVTGEAPAATPRRDVRERVGDRVEIGRDRESEEAVVIRRVDDDGDRGGINRANEAAQKFRRPDSARQNRQLR